MPFCPSCRSEFRDGVEVCAECDATLVDRLPPEAEVVWDGREWVTIDESGDEAHASIVEGFLAEGGVSTRLLRHGDRSFPTAHGGLSRFEVQVPAEDLDRALDLLESVDERDAAGGGPAGRRGSNG